MYGCSQSIEEQLAEFAKLKVGWYDPPDYPGLPYSPENLEKAKNWFNTNFVAEGLPIPYLFPDSDETIHFELEIGNWCMDANLDPEDMKFELFYYRINSENYIVEERFLEHFNLMNENENEKLVTILKTVVAKGIDCENHNKP
jgi:hypothetical protein